MPKIAPNSPLYAQFRADFPAQAGQGIPGDLNYSDTIVPIVDMTAAAGDGTLPTNLQQAWDASSSFGTQSGSGTTTIISNTGFWKILVQCEINFANTANGSVNLQIWDGTTASTFMRFTDSQANHNESFTVLQEALIFLRSGDVMRIASDAGFLTTVTYRQVATVNGVLVNPQDFSFN